MTKKGVKSKLIVFWNTYFHRCLLFVLEEGEGFSDIFLDHDSANKNWSQEKITMQGIAWIAYNIRDKKNQPPKWRSTDSCLLRHPKNPDPSYGNTKTLLMTPPGCQKTGGFDTPADIPRIFRVTSFYCSPQPSFCWSESTNLGLEVPVASSKDHLVDLAACHNSRSCWEALTGVQLVWRVHIYSILHIQIRSI